MWFFSRKKSLSEQGFFCGFTDYHCHVLPGVDDGFSDISKSLQALNGYEEMGAETVWFTPHIMEEMPNTPTKLRKCFEELCAAYSGKLKLKLAAEYMMDKNFLDLLEAGDLLTIVDDKHLLVETSYLMPQGDIYNILYGIRTKGLVPILAHPERYLYLSEEDLNKILRMGVKFQMNLPSIGGFYGKGVKKRAEQLLRQNAYSYYGTDLHRFHMLQKIADIKSKPLPQTP